MCILAFLHYLDFYSFRLFDFIMIVPPKSIPKLIKDFPGVSYEVMHLMPSLSLENK